MAILRSIILLLFTAVLGFGQQNYPTNPSRLPAGPEAMVRSLYHEVVTRKPIGIPEGADMRVFAPYLSRALLHRINLAVACYHDWLRQYPDPNLKPEVRWLELGLFSGDNEQASPRAFHIERMQVETDGSFRVYVSLTWGTRPEARFTWHVEVRVVRENGHFAVDDVLYLKDEGPDIESKLSKRLSAECQGSRWVGHSEPQDAIKK